MVQKSKPWVCTIFADFRLKIVSKSDIRGLWLQPVRVSDICWCTFQVCILCRARLLWCYIGVCPTFGWTPWSVRYLMVYVPSLHFVERELLYTRSERELHKLHEWTFGPIYKVIQQHYHGTVCPRGFVHFHVLISNFPISDHRNDNYVHKDRMNQ